MIAKLREVAKITRLFASYNNMKKTSQQRPETTECMMPQHPKVSVDDDGNVVRNIDKSERGLR